MGVVNNFHRITDKLSFDNKGDYYAIEIIKRRKDNPDMKKGFEVIDRAFITSLKQYNDYTKGIRRTCDEHGARAYMVLAKKNLLQSTVAIVNCLMKIFSGQHSIPKDVDPKDCWRVAHEIMNGVTIENYPLDFYFRKYKETPINIYIKKLLVSKGRVDKKLWMVDFDSFDLLELSRYQKEICDLLHIAKKKGGILTLPTVNGFHIVSESFNAQEFIKKFPQAEIKKSANVLLYFNAK